MTVLELSDKQRISSERRLGCLIRNGLPRYDAPRTYLVRGITSRYRYLLYSWDVQLRPRMRHSPTKASPPGELEASTSEGSHGEHRVTARLCCGIAAILDPKVVKERRW